MVTQKNGVIPSILRIRGAHSGVPIIYLSYGVNRIRAPSPANTATKPPMAMAISIITSRVDGEFEPL
jgi:hypothetical protein